METTRHKSLIALGSNDISCWGDARETVIQATKEVAQWAQAMPKCSALYATPAFPAGAGPDFVNAVIAIETDLSAAKLLATLHEIEAAAGRERTKRWGQRTLDLDLIAHGDLIAPDVETYQTWRTLPLAQQAEDAPTQLILPHPRLQDRGFVLVPLCDVAPDWVHPVLGKTARQLCADLPDAASAGVVRIGALEL